jgi:hypothetical protein
MNRKGVGMGEGKWYGIVGNHLIYLAADIYGTWWSTVY